MAVDHNNPQSRDEEILIATIDGTEYNKNPQSRMEELLLELKEVIEEGGGGGGTTDYENLSNQPQVNGETLIGDKSGADLGLVDAEEGKGLSTNDYDDTEKAAVAAATSAISAMQDGSDIDSFGDVEVALLDKADVSDLGTAAAKNSTNAVTSGSTDLVESGAVKDAIDAAVAAAYHHAGTKTVAQLTHDLLIAANEGNVYNITDSGTTTSDFIEGIGKTIDEGSNVGICKVGNAYKFDLLSGFVDTTNFVQKSATAGLLKNDGTVDTTIQGDIGSLKSGLTTLDNEVNGDATTYPYADVITIEDAVPANVADCSVKIEPVQDLHGQSAPYVGGAGKNKLITLLSRIKSVNSTGVWSGNTYTLNDITFEVLVDDAGNVLGIKINGTAGANTVFIITRSPQDDMYLAQNNYVLSGCPSGGSNNTYYIGVNHNTVAYGYDTGNGLSFAVEEGQESDVIGCWISIASGVSITNEVFQPMIRLSTESDSTFAPYTNICPITGHTEASVDRVGKNLFNPLRACTIANYWNDNILTRPNADVVINEDGSFTSSNTSPWCIYSKFYFKKNKTYYLSTNCIKDTFPNTYLGVCDSTGKNVKLEYHGRRITLDYDLDGYYVVYYEVDWTTGTFKNMVTLEQANIADYVPYAGKTYTIALGSTIYGGTVDFDSGVMTVDRGVKTYTGEQSENWIKDSTSWNPNWEHLYYISLQSDGISNFNNDTVYVLSNECEAISRNVLKDTDKPYCVALVSGGRDLELTAESTTVADFKTYLASNPLQVCYELATPTTIQLTPQQIQLLKGTNTLTASTGQISVTVNGVSGSIGAVQEQVNGLAEEVAEIKPLNYSTTEQKTGQKWIDGKDIYSRTWDFESDLVVVGDQWTPTIIDSTGIDMIIVVSGSGSNGSVLPLAADKANNVVRLGSWRDGNVGVRYLTLYYTKTT